MGIKRTTQIFCDRCKQEIKNNSYIAFKDSNVDPHDDNDMVVLCNMGNCIRYVSGAELVSMLRKSNETGNWSILIFYNEPIPGLDGCF